MRRRNPHPRHLSTDILLEEKKALLSLKTELASLTVEILMKIERIVAGL